MIQISSGHGTGRTGPIEVVQEVLVDLKNGIFIQQKWKIKMRCFLRVSGYNDYDDDDDDDDIDINGVSDLGRNDPRTRTRTKKSMM